MYRLCAILIFCQSVFGYENVYDLIERQNRRRYLNGYPLENRDIYFDRHPIFDGRYRYDRFGYRGNGYDNIGNGNVRARDRLHYFPEEEPFVRRYHGGFDRFYRKELPVFHDRYYHLRPYHGGRGFELDGRNDGRIYEEKDNADLYKIDTLVANNEGNNHRNLMEDFSDNKSSAVSDANRRENYGESSRSDRTNENKSTIRSNKVSKKGHVTKGFSTHHHKDETGNTTTFYDEFSDHGGQDDYKDVADGFGTKTISDHFTNVQDGKSYNEKSGQSGNHGTDSIAGTRKTEKNFVSNGNRFDRNHQIRFDARSGRLGTGWNFIGNGYAPNHNQFTYYYY